MTRLLQASERWFRLLQNLYPPDFRDEMGNSVVEAYMDRAAASLKTRGIIGLVALWFRALIDSLRNGPAERAYPAAGWRRSGNWGRDIELVRRRLARSPGFAAATLGTLTIGLGMFAVVFTAVQKILLDPMPYKNPDDLYYVWRDYGRIADVSRGTLTGTDILELQKPNSVLQDAAALQTFLGGVFSLGEGAEPMEVAVTATTPNVFDVLGVYPAIGRGFAPGEMAAGGRGVIVLTHHFWKRLGGDPAIIGKNIRLQGTPRTVIGVLPKDFTFVRSEASAPPQPVDAFAPYESELADKTSSRNNLFACLVRARHGASPSVVAAAVASVGRVIDERDFKGRGLKLFAVGLKADVISRIRPALIVLGAAGLVLAFMLMVNLASVLLARAAQREHEVAVSRALGANTAAIVRSTLLEGGLLGLVGGALGTLAAIWGTSALAALAPPDLPRRDTLALDWRIAAAVIAVGVLLGVLAAAAPAVWAVRSELSALLAGSAVRGGGGHGRLRRGMVVAQVALSLVLLSSGALVARSFQRLLRTDPGFRPEGVLAVRVRTPPEFFPKITEAIDFHARVQRAMSAIPGVTGSSAASSLPLTGGGSFQTVLTLPGAQQNPEEEKPVADLIAVRHGYVETMGIRVLAGHTFAENRPAGPAEVIVDSVLARRFFPKGDAVGSTIRVGNRPVTIIGVIGQARLYDVHTDGRPQLLMRDEDLGARPLFYMARTRRDPRSLLPEVRAAVHKLDPRVAVGDDKTMDEVVDASLSPQSIGAALIGAFAIGALLLAAMGLFGVVSGSVTRRRHELAVRLAVGADHGRLLRLVLKEGALLVSAGLLLGLPGIYFSSRLIRGLLIGVSPSDPLTLFAAALGLLLVTMASCYVPARRALRIDPAELLRRE
ncbi:MAG TPA: ADOP family duplicated permease [Gemmataceae bacterium]|nr:ADOP family duplicated permease [Gemmataceae bacterium]